MSYFHADHITLHPCIPWVSYFGAYHLILHPLASYFCADIITLHLPIPSASYFCAVHPLGDLFSCLPFIFPCFGELFLCQPSSLLVSYFCVSQPYNSPSVHPSASYFCAVHRLIELFSCLPFNFPSFGKLFLCWPFNSSSFGELLSCRHNNSLSAHPFSELFLCRPSLG